MGCHCLLHQKLGHGIFEGHIQPNESVMLSLTCKKLLNCHGRLQEMGLSWYSPESLLFIHLQCSFTARTDAEAPIHWPPDVKSQLIGKDLAAGKG